MPSPLSGVVDNAARLAGLLESELGCKKILFCCTGDHTRKTHGAKRNEIIAAVKQLLIDGVGGNGQVLVYIAGHGISVSKSNGNELDDLLLCADYVDQSSINACFSVDELTTILAQGLGAGSHLVLHDTCRTERSQKHSSLGLKFQPAATGVADRFQIASSSRGGAAENDSLFVDCLLESLSGLRSADTDNENPKHRWVTFTSLCDDLQGAHPKYGRAFQSKTDGASNFRIRKIPPARSVSTVREPDKKMVPPVEFLTYFDEVVFLGETNSQLAGIPRDNQWKVIAGKANFLEQAFERRGQHRWKRLDVFSIEDLKLAGRPDSSTEQLRQERQEVEEYLRANASRIAEELRVFRYDYAGYYGSFWSASNGARRVHVSRRVNGQDIRRAPSEDFIDCPEQRLPAIDALHKSLQRVYTHPATRLIVHQSASSRVKTKSNREFFISPDFETQTPALPRPEASPGTPSFAGTMSARAARAFRLASPRDIAGRKRAIVGPKKIGQLVEDAERAREKLARGERPAPLEMAALEQAIRLLRPAMLCVRDGLTILPYEGNWLADRWLHFQPILQRNQTSVARLDRVDDPDKKKQGLSSWGTGFLVAPNLLMTAGHVVTELSFSTGMLERGQAQAEFEGFYGKPESHVCNIAEVVALDTKLDLALLRFDSGKTDFSSRPMLLDTISRSIPEFPVCVIGYPLVSTRSPPELVARLFEGKFGVKRAAIGEILEATPRRFTHDCSTLGGNSGSPVIDVNTGRLCGVHVSGMAMVENEAVNAEAAMDFFQSNVNKPSQPRHIQREPKPMKHDKRDFQEYLQELKSADPEIARELEESFESARSESASTRSSEMVLETIVLLKGRPVLDVIDGQAVLEINDIESNVWKERLRNAIPHLRPHIPAVGRIEVLNHPERDWFGTGWLVRDNIVVTNRHVAAAFAEMDGGRFFFQPGVDGTPIKARIDFIEEFGNDRAHEFPLFEIVHIEKSSGPDIAFLRIEPVSGHGLPEPIPIDNSKVAAGEHIVVIGYPARDPTFPQPAEMDRIFNGRYDKKRLAPGIVKEVTNQRIFHDCSTLGGNSGSEIVSLESGKAVALHFAGTLFTKNHAIPIPVVNETLDRVLNNQGRRRPSVDRNSENQPRFASGRVLEATVPLRIRVEIGDIIEGDRLNVSAPAPPPPATPSAGSGFRVSDPEADDDIIELEIPRKEDYRDREGYDSSFLGDDIEVPLPAIARHEDDVITFDFLGEEMTELRYKHFTVVMSEMRRQCRFSACNIDGKKSKKTTRPAWRYDPRIDKSFQIMKECYGNPPRFSRGHMTRREDPAWGTQTDADMGNSDSMHVTNAVPQLQMFNGGVWLALEDYALQNARKDKMQICVFTGPFLYDADIGFREFTRHGVYIPSTFWKVIAFIHDETGELTATGYTMSQESFLGDDREEFVFGRFKTHQSPIHRIEHRSGLSFGTLAELDPLRDQPESVAPILTRLNQIRYF